jgi:hypothetical protein
MLTGNKLTKPLPMMSPEGCQQRLCFLQVSRLKPLGTPVINIGQELPCFGLFALLLPQTAQTHRGAEPQRLGLLVAGDGEHLLETPVRLCRVSTILLEQELALKPVQLCA